MGVFGTLRKIYQHFTFLGRATQLPYEMQKAKLDSFPEPKDDYERSFYKFQCYKDYCFYGKKWQIIGFNIASFFYLPFLHLRLKRNAKILIPEGETFDLVVENVPALPNNDILPGEMKAKYPRIKDFTKIEYGKGCTDEIAEQIFSELKRRHPFRFYYRMIIMLKIGLFAYYIKMYQPKAIAMYSIERDFSGPLQTLYCESKGSRYEAFMHGDYLWGLIFCFQRHSLYYTWGESYNEMFRSLRTVSPMQVYVPEKLKGIAEKKDIHDCPYFATYYFSDETKEYAMTVKKAFDVFETAGLRCKVRPHPRFSNTPMLKEIFGKENVEQVPGTSLGDSITDSYYIVGLNTTVLSEAFFSGKNVVIDDLSAKHEYELLKERGYVMMAREHVLLSDLVNQLKQDPDMYDSGYAFKLK